MRCVNCGNDISSSDSVCQTCGTPRPVAPESPAERAVAGAGSSPVSTGLVVAIVLAGLVLVGGVAAVLLVRSGGDASGDVVIDAGVESGALAPVSPAVPTDAQPSGWQSAIADRALARFDEPTNDLAIGQLAPSVQGSSFDGSPVLIAPDGRPKVLVFLAHWCPHCQREVPAVQAYLNENGLDDGIDFISIATAIDPNRPNYPPDDWLEGEGWTAPVIVDPDAAVSTAYGLSAFPYYVFLREDFTVDLRVAGEFDPAVVFEYAQTLFGPAPEPVPRGPATYEEALLQRTACGAISPPPLESLTFEAPGTASGAETLTFVTSCGDIVVDLDPAAAPETVNSMLFLAESGYFDGTVCHRLVPGFVLQCGDPTATGRGDPGYRLPDEFPEGTGAYTQGVVAMANAGPGTTGSQFFVVIGDASALSPTFTVVGRVEDVSPLVAALDSVPLGTNQIGELSAPLETIYIESAVSG